MPAEPDPLNPSRKLYTYEGSQRPFEMPVKTGVHLAQIQAHIQRHIGPVHTVFHEIISDQAARSGDPDERSARLQMENGSNAHELCATSMAACQREVVCSGLRE